MSLGTEQLLARLVALDTTSSRSNLELIETIADYLDGHGVAVTLVHDAAGQKANLFATIGPAIDGGIVLSGHSDCVPVDGQRWSTDPFRAVTVGGRIYGRGTCDMKGFIACVLALVPEMVAAKPRTPLHLAFSYDEELGCRGVPTLLAKIARELPQPRIAIVGEPTGMALVNAHKGIYAFETVATGLAAHSSQTHEALSAVVHGAEIVCRLDALARELAAEGPFDAAFTPPYTTINVGRIDGGTAVNVVAGECRIEWECRPVPGHDVQAVLARLTEFVEGDLLPRMRARYPDASVVTRRVVAAPSLVPAAGSPAEALVRRLTSAGPARAVAFATEAGLFQEAGMSAVVVGPGSIDHAHKPDEHVAIGQLRECETLLRAVIDYARRTEAGQGP
ncbi:MAG TPA: acetylornithine deacetylase [Gammaproteobacteria bacterium]